MDTEIIINEIINDCFWDYKVLPEDIKNIVSSDDFRTKKKLFSKIIYNSKDRLNSLQIFNNKDLKALFDTFEVSYNHDYITKIVNILRNILFEENNRIVNLEWKK